MADKFDVFVGNLTFATTEDHLREKFQFIAPVKSIRILTDKETGKPKGFAFVEYFDTNSALSAIKHLDQTELNGRRIRVGFPSQSNLKEVAKAIGYSAQDVATNALAQRQLQEILDIVGSLPLHEAWDALEAMKKLVAEDRRGSQRVRHLLESHPALMLAIYEAEKRLGIVLPLHVQQQLSPPQPILSAGISQPPPPPGPPPPPAPRLITQTESHSQIQLQQYPVDILDPVFFQASHQSSHGSYGAFVNDTSMITSNFGGATEDFPGVYHLNNPSISVNSSYEIQNQRLFAPPPPMPPAMAAPRSSRFSNQQL